VKPEISVVDLRKYFGEVKAVDGVSLEVNPKSIVSIIGPNGAGKTTLLNLVSGLIKPDSGRVYFRGRDVTGWSPAKLVKLGLARCFQISNVYDTLTVLDNVRAALHSVRRAAFSLKSTYYSIQSVNEKAKEVLELFNLWDKREKTPTELSHGDRKLLDIAISYALAPKAMLLDEPTAGMSIREKRRTVDVIKMLRDKLGVTVMLVEHDLDVVYEISDEVIVMHEGKVIARGKPEEIKRVQAVREVYLGE